MLLLLWITGCDELLESPEPLLPAGEDLGGVWFGPAPNPTENRWTSLHLSTHLGEFRSLYFDAELRDIRDLRTWSGDVPGIPRLLAHVVATDVREADALGEIASLVIDFGDAGGWGALPVGLTLPIRGDADLYGRWESPVSAAAAAAGGPPVFQIFERVTEWADVGPVTFRIDGAIEYGDRVLAILEGTVDTPILGSGYYDADLYEGEGEIEDLFGDWSAPTDAARFTFGESGFAGVDTAGCSYDGQLTRIAKGRRVLSLELTVNGCGSFDGEYGGLAIAIPAEETSEPDLLIFQIDNVQFVLSGLLVRSPPAAGA